MNLNAPTMPNMSRNQLYAVAILSLVWLWYLVSVVPAFAATQDRKKLSPIKTVLSVMLGIVLSFLIVSVLTKGLKNKHGEAHSEVHDDALMIASSSTSRAGAGSRAGAVGTKGAGTKGAKVPDLGFDAGDMSLDSTDLSSSSGLDYGDGAGGAPGGPSGAMGGKSGVGNSDGASSGY